MLSTLHTRRVAIVLLPQPHPFGMKLINQCFLCSFVPWCFGFPALGKKKQEQFKRKGWGQGQCCRHWHHPCAWQPSLCGAKVRGLGAGCRHCSMAQSSCSCSLVTARQLPPRGITGLVRGLSGSLSEGQPHALQ